MPVMYKERFCFILLAVEAKLFVFQLGMESLYLSCHKSFCFFSLFHHFVIRLFVVRSHTNMPLVNICMSSRGIDLTVAVTYKMRALNE